MLKYLTAYITWFYQVCYQAVCGVRLRWMVWRYPTEARIAATRARWVGTQENDPALLAGAEMIERWLAHK